MKYALVIALFCAAFFVNTNGFAQDTLSDFFDEPKETVIDPNAYTHEDLGNAYFARCVQQNNRADLQSYVDLQCACTAKEAMDFMSKQELATALTDKHPEQAFQLSRLVLNAYIPCLKEPIKNYVFDNCVAEDNQTPNRPQTMRNSKAVCGCIGQGLSDFTQDHAEFVLFNHRTGQPKHVSADSNPFLAMITDRTFNVKFRYYTPKCMHVHRR